MGKPTGAPWPIASATDCSRTSRLEIMRQLLPPGPAQRPLQYGGGIFWAGSTEVAVFLLRRSRLLTRYVDMRALTGPAQGDVASLPIHLVPGDDEGLIRGEALGLMDGEGVAVVEPTALQVVAGHDNLATGKAHDERAVGGPHRGDGAAGAVD
jgi:hypothetical protein